MKCETCGHIISSSGVKLSAIEFRRYVNSITDLNTLIGSKDYLTRFIKSRYRSVDDIKIWILGFVNNPDHRNPSEEVELYKFLQAEYSGLDAEHQKRHHSSGISHASGINETFGEFYQNYFSSINNPMNKNQVSRALSALGLKTEMKKIVRDNKPKSSIVVCATQDELSEILRKNGLCQRHDAPHLIPNSDVTSMSLAQ